MSGSRRDIDILRKIVQYCDEIKQADGYFNGSFDVLKANVHYKNATAMCILQIGELANHLSDDFKAHYDAMPWRAIRNMRNIAAHQYGDFSVEALWDTISDDIPALYEYCMGIIGQHEKPEE